MTPIEKFENPTHSQWVRELLSFLSKWYGKIRQGKLPLKEVMVPCAYAGKRSQQRMQDKWHEFHQQLLLPGKRGVSESSENTDYARAMFFQLLSKILQMVRSSGEKRNCCRGRSEQRWAGVSAVTRGPGLFFKRQ